MAAAIRIALAIVVGLVAGSVVNMALIVVGPRIVPPPAGVDMTTAEGLKASMHLLEARHFVFPFVAHALGTFVGALLAAWLSPGRRAWPAYVVGALFLAGDIANVAMLPAPAWFSALDLLAAYLPAAWIAQHIACRSGPAPGGPAAGQA